MAEQLGMQIAALVGIAPWLIRKAVELNPSLVQGAPEPGTSPRRSRPPGRRKPGSGRGDPGLGAAAGYQYTLVGCRRNTQPASAAAGGAAFTLTVRATGFQANSTWWLWWRKRGVGLLSALRRSLRQARAPATADAEECGGVAIVTTATWSGCGCSTRLRNSSTLCANASNRSSIVIGRLALRRQPHCTGKDLTFIE